MQFTQISEKGRNDTFIIAFESWMTQNGPKNSNILIAKQNLHKILDSAELHSLEDQNLCNSNKENGNIFDLIRFITPR